ncbi:hypothetical protein T492DRAFT_863101 [Pavlovales sp. CCMP2436]|nr:hypothetical protein T492DRAFT_863101 [Pavlovales sp. CCMP2436]
MELLPSRLPAERVLVFTAHGDNIVSMRHYAIAVGSIDADKVVMAAAAAAAAAKEKGVGLRGEGTRHVSLTEIGPRCDLKLNRTRFADDDLRKDALKRPKSSATVPTKVKNDLHQAALKKVKALKIKKGKPEKPEKPKPAE